MPTSPLEAVSAAPHPPEREKFPKALFSVGSVVGAFAASVCCLGPLALFGLGVSGAWVSNLSVLLPYQPVFAVLTFGLLGAGFYRTYRKPDAAACPPGQSCAAPAAERINKAALWFATVLVTAGLGVRFVAPLLY
ncbi:MAG: mercuric transporter MerT family protein [Terriglobia bacterium]